MESQPTVRIGRVVKPHGVRGELVVEPLGDSVALLDPGADLGVGKSAQRMELLAIRPHAGRWLMVLEGIDDREAAEALRGAWLTVPESTLPAAGDGEAYVDDLIGCELRDERGERLGRIADVLSGSAQDVLEVDTENGRVLVPMVAEWLLELAPDKGFVRMRLPPGLV